MHNKFSPLQITLHWFTFLSIIIAWAVVEIRDYIPKDLSIYKQLMPIHFIAGTIVLLLMLIRLLLRYCFSYPEIYPQPPSWQLNLAKLAHLLLYALFISLPLLGLSAKYFYGNAWTLLGISMPIAKLTNKELAFELIRWHKSIILYCYLLIGLHAIAALFHHYWLKDTTLLRMLPSHVKKANRL